LGEDRQIAHPEQSLDSTFPVVVKERLVRMKARTLKLEFRRV